MVAIVQIALDTSQSGQWLARLMPASLLWAEMSAEENHSYLSPVRSLDPCHNLEGPINVDLVNEFIYLTNSY